MLALPSPMGQWYPARRDAVSGFWARERGEEVLGVIRNWIKWCRGWELVRLCMVQPLVQRHGDAWGSPAP